MRRAWIIWAVLITFFACLPAAGDTIRIATFNASLSRNGPGLLIRDLMKNQRQVAAVARIIQIVRPDILLLNEFDHDVDGIALRLFREFLAEGDMAISYDHAFAPAPNTGYPSELDLNGDGKVHGPDDAFGYGKFPGQYGMALLSRFPIDAAAARSFATLRWADFPGAMMPENPDGTPFPSAEAAAAMRLSSKSHWDVPVLLPSGPLHILASHPTPPVFDGPEDRNGRRNHDEILFWVRYLDGDAFSDDAGQVAAFAGRDFVVMGDLNSDPADGDSRKGAIRALLTHPGIKDPKPTAIGGQIAAGRQRGANADQSGNPGMDTADWRDDRGPGNLRVDYVLPSVRLTVADTGVFWPAPDDPNITLIGTGKKPVSSDHRLVWIDIHPPK